MPARKHPCYMALAAVVRLSADVGPGLQLQPLRLLRYWGWLCSGRRWGSWAVLLRTIFFEVTIILAWYTIFWGGVCGLVLHFPRNPHSNTRWDPYVSTCWHPEDRTLQAQLKPTATSGVAAIESWEEIPGIEDIVRRAQELEAVA